MYDLSWLNPTPHAIAVYASQPLSPVATQHSLPSGCYSLLGPDLHRLDRTSFAWRTHPITSIPDDAPVMTAHGPNLRLSICARISVSHGKRRQAAWRDRFSAHRCAASPGQPGSNPVFRVCPLHVRLGTASGIPSGTVRPRSSAMSGSS